MNEAVVVALITAVATVAAQLVIAHSNQERNEVQRARRDQSLDDRLAGIERKLDEHNSYASRFENIEKELVEMKKDIEFIKKGAKK